MLKHWFFYLFLLLTAHATAQDIFMDPQKMEAGKIKPDTNFINYLLTTGMAYSKSGTKNDSAEMFFLKAMAVAEQIKWPRGLLESNENLGEFYGRKGKLSQSLNILLKNENLAIEMGDSIALFNTLRNVLSIYTRIGDVNMARTTLKRRQNILDNNGIKGLKDTSYFVLSQYNSLAVFYNSKEVNQPDSAGYYFRKLYQVGRLTSNPRLYILLGSAGLGQYFYTKGIYDSAINYLSIAKAVAFQDKGFFTYFKVLLKLSKVYQQAGQLDSAFFYAYIAYNGATTSSYLETIAESSTMLAGLYKQQHTYDSAIKYMEFEMLYKDSISGKETLRGIQVLTSEQQVKEQEKQRQKEEIVKEYKASIRTWFLTGVFLLLVIIIAFMYRVSNQRSQSKKQIEKAYNELKATQSQLIQSEKMASLGELTAGIAHEIQNPLNFVNNFSEVNKELLDELKAELAIGNMQFASELADDIKANEEKINHHGKRADAIVKGMLQHSRSSSGVKEPTDINALCDEYLRLSYHGLRAKDKSFNATMKTDFDTSLEKINIIPQDIGRVLLNLINNAFYAASLPSEGEFPDPDHNKTPTVWVSSKKNGNKVLISVKDNGPGIPPKILDKIFQPFFTTKPTGQGTGLGLSLSYDIIKAHGGEIKVETKEGEGTTFTIEITT